MGGQKKWTYEQNRSWIDNQKGVEVPIPGVIWRLEPGFVSYSRILWLKEGLGPYEKGPCKITPVVYGSDSRVFNPKDPPLLIQVTEYWGKGNVWIFGRLLYTECVNWCWYLGPKALSWLLCYNRVIWGMGLVRNGVLSPKLNPVVASTAVAMPDVVYSLEQIIIALVIWNAVIDLAMHSFLYPPERRIVSNLHLHERDNSIHLWSCSRAMLILLLCHNVVWRDVDHLDILQNIAYWFTISMTLY